MDYKRVNNDINGNPRYVFHFMAFLTDEDIENTPSVLYKISQMYDLAIRRSRAIGGKKYRGKDFGGGIVLQSYNVRETIKQIEALRNE